MHGNLYRISVDQSLNTFRLVSVGQLVCSIHIDFNFTACRFFYQFTKFSSTFCPGTGLSGGAGKVPGLLGPSKVTVIFHIIRSDGSTFIITGKCSDQICGIIISLIFQFFLIPLINTVYRFFERINIHVFIFGDRHAVFFLPAAHDLVVSGTVDLTFIIYRFLSCFVNNGLLFRCQTVIDITIDTEEQTVIVCIPQGAVWLYFLHTGCIDSRQRILLSFYGFLLQGRISFGPVHVGRICSPSLITLHQQVTSCHTDLQVFHIFYGSDFLSAVGQLAEAVFCNPHTMQSIFIQDCFQFFSCLSVKLCVGIFHRFEQER